MPKHRSTSFILRAFLLLSVCALGALALTAPAGCFLNEKDPFYCPDRPNHYCACKADTDCAAPTAVCAVATTNTCVECTPESAAACTGSKPVCGGDNACRGCAAHADCAASAACLPDGACAAEPDVAYVSPTGTDNNQCSKAMPCTKVAKALATMRPYVKFSGTTDEATVVDNRTVTFLAEPGAKLTRTNNGILLEVKNGARLDVYDLEITGASGASGIGISLPIGTTSTLRLERAKVTNNAGGGVVAAGASVRASQSTISGNSAGGMLLTGGSSSIVRSAISGNAGGGISISNGTFEIVNNFFFANGGQATTVGGLSITTTQNVANRLEFNSFNKNQTQDGIGPGIQCVAGTFTARNNILSGNGTLTQTTQYGGTCQHAYSIFTPGTLPGGMGNAASDPLFLNTTTGNLHVAAASPVRGMADPASALSGPAGVDIDGEARVSPADIGADEVP